MIFEWDEKKSQSNKEKHGIDFASARSLWMDDGRIEIELPFADENRWVLLARAQGKIWAAVFTMRKETIRLICVRRARKKEVQLYEEKTIGRDSR